MFPERYFNYLCTKTICTGYSLIFFKFIHETAYVNKCKHIYNRLLPDAFHDLFKSSGQLPQYGVG